MNPQLATSASGRNAEATAYACITVGETLSVVIESQLFTPASCLPGHWRKLWLAVTPIGQWLRRMWRQRLQARKRLAEQRYRLEVHLLAAPPSRWFHSKWTERFHSARLLRTLRRIPGRIVIHGRGCRAAILAAALAEKLGPRAISVYDCRGDAAYEELAIAAGGEFASERWTAEQHRVFAAGLAAMSAAMRCDLAVCVSSKLAEVLVERHQATRERVVVLPCGLDASRFPSETRAAARARLGLADRYVVVYLGSLEWYQLPQQSLRLFRLTRRLRSNAFLLVVTTSPEKMQRLLQDSGVPEDQYRIVLLGSHETANALQATDLGLLPRARNPVNEVAAPVKFAEYLAAGVPVVTTAWVGDYSQAVIDHDLGAIVDLEAGDETIVSQLRPVVDAPESDGIERRARCQRYARSFMSWQDNVDAHLLPALERAFERRNANQ